MILPHPDHLLRVETPAGRPAASCPASGRHDEAQLEQAKAELTALVTRAQAGDMAAQSELVLRYQRRLAGQIRLIVREPAAVEDVVQIVLVKMLRRLGRLRDPAAFECWLFRLSRNSALDFIRRQRRRPITVAADDELHQIADTSNTSATNEIMEALDRALAQLSQKDRSLVTLFVQGHSYRVIAAREGLTTEAVKARLHRARPLLRASVGQATETRPPVGKGWGLSGSRLAA
jgi:RNA polymerase sigma-70 factor, ECF subfamily